MRKTRYAAIGFFALVLVLIVALLATSFSRRQPTPSLEQTAIPLENWEFVSVDGLSQSEVDQILSGEKEVEWQSYTAPGVPQLEQKTVRFISRTHLPDYSLQDPSVLLEMYDHLFKAYQDGKQIYSFGVVEGEFVADAIGNTVCFIPLQPGYEAHYLYLDSYSLLSSNTGYIKEATFSSQSFNLLTVAREGFPRFAISVLLIVSGLVFMLFTGSKQRVSFLQIGLLSLCIGLWFFFDSNRTLALVNINPLTAQYLGLLSMFLAPVFFGQFLRDSFQDNSLISRLIHYWIYASLLFIAVACFLDVVFAIRLIHTLFIFHGMVVVWVLLCFARVLQVCLHQQEDAHILALACVILAVTASVEILGFASHIAILQMGYVSYAMIAFIATLAYLPVKRVAKLNQQVYEYSVEITKNSETLEKIIVALSHVLEHQSRESLIFEILDQLVNIINVEQLNSEISSIVALHSDDQWKIFSQTGDSTVQDARHYINLYSGKERVLFDDGSLVLYFTFEKKLECVLLVKNVQQISENAKRFVEIYFTCVYAAYNNLRLNREVITSQESIIYALGNITEGRSHNTGQHIQRVAEYSRHLALRWGLEEKEADVVKIASSMHDIGKLGIQDSILNKPGKLTEEEFEIMKRHATIGYDMLSGSAGELIQASALIALQHHERYNGKGYPCGLAGEEIHIYGRIVAVADVFDALLTERPYKQPWPIEDVLAYFREESGQHFDPRLVEIVLEDVDSMLEIKRAFPDYEQDSQPIALSGKCGG